MRAAERNFTAVAVDISEGGLGAVVDQEIEANTPVRVSFALVNEEPGSDREMRRWLDLEGTSLYCTFAPRTGFRAGIEFKNLPAEDREFIARYIETKHLKKIHEERPR
jgi:c-di-GMP-binding flagellar brake protein YcgR